MYRYLHICYIDLKIISEPESCFSLSKENRFSIIHSETLLSNASKCSSHECTIASSNCVFVTYNTEEGEDIKNTVSLITEQSGSEATVIYNHLRGVFGSYNLFI